MTTRELLHRQADDKIIIIRATLQNNTVVTYEGKPYDLLRQCPPYILDHAIKCVKFSKDHDILLYQA